jgi:hypothetical protein
LTLQAQQLTGAREAWSVAFCWPNRSRATPVQTAPALLHRLGSCGVGEITGSDTNAGQWWSDDLLTLGG